MALADNEITCYAEGGARVLGLENGDIRDTSDKTDSRCRVHGGRLVAYIAKGMRGEQTSARLHFISPLLKSAEVEIEMR